MYKILLADNEGVVLRSLAHMIYARFGTDCDVRMAQTAGYARSLARKFLPDAAILNIQMSGMHGFDIIREIRAFHPKCVFITIAASNKPYLDLEAQNMNVSAHLCKPLSRGRIMPALENAAALVLQARKRAAQNRLVWEKFNMAVPYLENDLINQLFFPDTCAAALPRYQTLLGISAKYGRIITLLFGEPADTNEPPQADNTAGRLTPDGKKLQNPVGCVIHLHRNYMLFYETVKKELPDCLVSSVMANRVFLLLPCAEVPAKEEAAFSAALSRLTDALEDALPGLSFYASAGAVRPLSDLRLQ